MHFLFKVLICCRLFTFPLAVTGKYTCWLPKMQETTWGGQIKAVLCADRAWQWGLKEDNKAQDTEAHPALSKVSYVSTVAFLHRPAQNWCLAACEMCHCPQEACFGLPCTTCWLVVAYSQLSTYLKQQRTAGVISKSAHNLWMGFWSPCPVQRDCIACGELGTWVSSGGRVQPLCFFC